MAKKIVLPSVVLVLLVGILTVSVVGAQGSPDSPPAEDDGASREDAVERLFDEDGNMFGPDQHLAEIAKEHEGGFGGFYFDADDPSQAYVYMTDTNETSAAQSAFNEAYAGDQAVSGITVVQGNHAFDQLLDWFHALDAALVEDGVAPSSGAVLESENRIRFGFRTSEEITDAREVADDLEVPATAVNFVISNPVLLGDKDNVKSKWRPVVGGIQYQYRYNWSKCTVGFTTKRGNTNGLVVPSHCTSNPSDIAIGGSMNSPIHQPNFPRSGSNEVAREITDPPLSQVDDPLGQCADGYWCRYSDAAFAEMTDETMDRGKIAKPTEIGKTKVSPAGTTFSVTSDSGGFSQNDVVYYVGRSEGWQKASVLDTCTFKEVVDDVIRVICVGRARVTEGGGPSSGDSGAPVFKITSGSNVKLIGMLFAGDADEDDVFYFSSLGHIYNELGSSYSWQSCTSGC